MSDTPATLPATPTTPGDVIDGFATFLSAGDLAAALELYDGDAAFLGTPASVTRGDDLRSALAGFFALRPTLTPGPRRVIVAGDTALVVHDWHLRGTLPDGAPVEQQGRAVDVLRRQLDGTWRLLIDDPWGVTVLDDGAAAAL
jgi:uncharacterized protein (TIGR02246 family)